MPLRTNLRPSAVAYADRIIAQAGTAKAAARAVQTEARTQRRRRRAQITLPQLRLGRDEAIEPVEVRVPDPWPNPGDPAPPTVPATVNRRVDILQNEFSNKRISESQFRTGLFAVFFAGGAAAAP